jgi:SAM-dependent methyltransferase
LKRRLRFIEQVATRTANRTLLDVGCGDGSFLVASARKGWMVTGTELNPQAARAKGLTVRERIDDLPPENHFDCITMWHTLEHMPDPVGMLKQLRTRLQPNGRLIVAVPDFGGFQARIFRSHWLHLDVPRHLYHFDGTSLAYCLAAAGFVIDRRWHQEFEYDLLGWAQSTLNWLLPKPNLFFDWLTGKRAAAGALLISLAVVLGGIVSILLLPALLAGTLAKRGGTLIVGARPCHEQQADNLLPDV